MIVEFSYKGPTSESTLLELLSDTSRKAKLLAGGTDLLVGIRGGVYKPDLVLDLKKIPEYQKLVLGEDHALTIGPAVTINEILSNKVVQQYHPLLCACAKDLASYQIRNRATVVGNIVNASPCSDMAPALLCLDATITIASVRGKREVAIGEFFTGVKKTVLEKDELVTAVHVPASSASANGVYRKLKRIQGHDLGIVGVAVAQVQGKLRIAVSSAAPTPVVTKPLDGTLSVEALLKEVDSIISPISDVRCSQEYRRFMVLEYTKYLLREVTSC
ncbi:FAD binding domain-containing protein [Sphaerochaeta globosa]|uniref:Molybdopterin dehydrogenase FAD-binding protein n=1 Tax=Sphaerochaeta globosa (strain ATCC BAA-1886 / DSM 22777 / Buddy) TaxID=158189 RepID=F0RTC5_SPHGB|nr:FAD binding domain-containing protein [Sphaerochaeta globosa]ADY14410.1 molybdopterin dehydrogenase FAD-binding protein [Sphaerochaeta globosa str. Buddy]